MLPVTTLHGIRLWQRIAFTLETYRCVRVRNWKAYVIPMAKFWAPRCKEFQFVQFESEEIANKCADSLNKSTFKSRELKVRNASLKTKSAKKGNLVVTAAGIGGGGVGPMTVQGGIVMSAAAAASAVPINDCEIIVVNRDNT